MKSKRRRAKGIFKLTPDQKKRIIELKLLKRGERLVTKEKILKLRLEKANQKLKEFNEDKKTLTDRSKK
jgi:hypothetical protein